MSFHEGKEISGTSIQKPTNLTCEYTVNPIGIDVVNPRFSWVLTHSERGRTQSTYQILVTRSWKNLLYDLGDIWDTGKIESEESINIEYQGKPLESGSKYFWKVRWWDDKDRSSPYSDVSEFETGLFSEDDWGAKWIKGGDLLRNKFSICKKVKSARVYVCGLGQYELRINGRKVGDRVLDPGWTDYDKLVLYSTYDVTEFLKEGENVVGVILGNGRYVLGPSSKSLPQRFKLKTYENASPKVIFHMNVEFSDNSAEIFTSKENWKIEKGPIIENDLFDGEIYDARLEKEGWDTPGYDDSAWKNADLAVPPKGRLVSQATFPPINVTKIIEPLRISNPRPGVYIYDFGQNFAGWARLTLSGPRGTKVKLRFAELLYTDGMINTATNRTARATDVYVLKGNGTEVYEPRFTYHGFRYAEITGFPGTPSLDSLKGVVVNSVVTPAGGFLCSNPLINNIHKNVLWGQLSNLLSIPTDCPQRDERQGWMGDAQLTVEEAIYNFDMAAFYTKWVGDIREARLEDGSVPDVVPPYWQFSPADPAWGTACVIIPWNLYLYYGDKRILDENYELMKDWVNFLGTISEGHILKFSKYGDWCPPAHTRSLDTPGNLVSTWCYFQDVLTLSEIALILGKLDEAERYSKLSEKIKEAFNREFLTDTHYASGSQTSNLLPLWLDMVPEAKKEVVLDYFLDDIVTKHDHHVSTGILGTRYILDTLTKHGHADTAYKIVTQTTYPSWGYMIKEGATTLWERWEHLTGGGMNSHNHIMFGSIDAWFYNVLAGINPDVSAPGFKGVIIKPHIIDDLSHVSASVNTIRGLVSSSWKKEGGTVVLDVTLPVNSTGIIYIPDLGIENPVIKEGEDIVWEEGSYIHGVQGIVSGERGNGYIIFHTGSGSYSFEVDESS